MFDDSAGERYNREALPANGKAINSEEVALETYLDIALIITSIALIAIVVLQSKGAGLGGLTGSDMGTVFSARRGLEKTFFQLTIVLSVIFFILTLAVAIITKAG